ncbi:MAG: M50 family metallopeptidase [Fimbriimonas sp.]
MGAVLNLLNILLIAVVFVTMISILVAAHEWGHYLFARMFGMGVEEFAIGFGKKPLVIWKRRFYTVPLAPGQHSGIASESGDSGNGGSLGFLEGKSQDDRISVVQEGDRSYLRERTDFTVRPWPLGGFVRIKGMMPEEDGSETRVAGGFYSKPPWQRLLVLFAGPLFSVIAGVAILVPLFMFHGVPKISDEAVVGMVVKDGAAEKAGLRAGDRVLSVNGQPVKKFFDMTRVVRESADKPVSLEVRRNGKVVALSVVPKLDDKPTPWVNADGEEDGQPRRQAKIGAAATRTRIFVPVDAGTAFAEAVGLPVKAVLGLVKIFTKPADIKENLGGPGTMIQQTSQAVENGIPAVLLLSAFLSISVGIFNLLPAPPLDGGQMAIAFAEMLRGGRRLSMRVQLAVGTVGTLFVACLVLTAIAVDIQRLVLDRKPASAAPQKK